MRQSIKNKLIFAVAMFVLLSLPAISLAAKKYMPTPQELQPPPPNSVPNYRGSFDFSSGENTAPLPVGSEAGGQNGAGNTSAGINSGAQKNFSSAGKTTGSFGIVLLIILCAGALLGYVYVRKGKNGKG